MQKILIGRDNVYMPIEDVICQEIPYDVWANVQDDIWIDVKSVLRSVSISDDGIINSFRLFHEHYYR